MQNTSSTKSIIISVYTYVQFQRDNGVYPTQTMIVKYLKDIYQMNPYLFGKATWESVSGTFRSMVSKMRRGENRTKGLAKYIVICDRFGCKRFLLKP